MLRGNNSYLPLPVAGLQNIWSGVATCIFNQHPTPRPPFPNLQAPPP
jgi:hypothetical protein